jgi:hypothetical protein
LGPIELHLKPETKAMNRSFKQEKQKFQISHQGTKISDLSCEFGRKIIIPDSALISMYSK